VIRGNVEGDLFRARDTGSFVEAVGREPARLRIGWSVRPAIRGLRPDPLHVRAVEDTARLLAELGHHVVEVDPHYPDATAAFVPQFFAGIRSEADEVEHFDRLERRTREAYRMGAWVRPRVVEWAMAQSQQISTKVNRIFDDVDVLLTPTIAHRPPKVGVIGGRGLVGSALKAQPAIAYAAMWNVTGNPAASVPSGVAPDGLPLAVQLVGRTDDEPTLLSLAAQLEKARPWPLLAGTGL
jgi:amidase